MNTPSTPTRSHRALWFALGAGLLSLVLTYVPLAGVVLYPVRLLVTLIHEGGHALATLLTGGAVRRIELYANGSGVTFSAGGWLPLIIPAGYLGAALLGALMLYLLKHSAAGRRSLYALGAGVLILTLLFVRNLFGLVTGLGLAGVLFAAGALLPPLGAFFLAAFLAVQVCLNAVLDLVGLTMMTGFFDASHNDAVSMARLTFIPPIVWAALWAALSLVIVGVGVRALLKD